MKALRRLGVIILMLSLLAGCGTVPQPKLDSALPVITLWHSYQGEALKGLEKAVKGLSETNPPYSLQLVYVAQDSYYTKLTQAWAADKGPDALLISWEKLPELYSAGIIQPVDKLFDAKNYFSASLEALTLEGKLMAVPKSVRVPLLAINRDLSPANPVGLEQLVDSAAKLTNNKGVGLSGDLSNLFLVSPLYSAYGGRYFSQDAWPTLNTSENVNFLGAISSLGGVRAGLFNPASSKELFASGTTPFGLLDSAELQAYRATGKNLAFSSVLGPGGKEGRSNIKAEGFAVSSNSRYAKEVVAAEVYLTSPAALALYSINQGEFPASPLSYDQPPLKDNPDAQLIKRIAAAGVGVSNDARTIALNPLISQMIKDVLAGAAPEQAAATAQEKSLKVFGFENP